MFFPRIGAGGRTWWCAKAPFWENGYFTIQQIRWDIVAIGGATTFNGYYTGTYHGSVPTAGGWTIAAGSNSAINAELGRPWSTATNDLDTFAGNCAVVFGQPWYYSACMDAISMTSANEPASSLPMASSAPQQSFSIFVREVSTPTFTDPSLAAAPEPATFVLTLSALALGIMRALRKRSKTRGQA